MSCFNYECGFLFLLEPQVCSREAETAEERKKEELSLRLAPIISVNKQTWIIHDSQMLLRKYPMASV